MDYQAEIKVRLQKVLLTLLDLLASKKFLVAVGSGVTIYQATGDVWAAVAPVVTYLVAQGLADFGKEAVKPKPIDPAVSIPKPVTAPVAQTDLFALFPNAIANKLVEGGYSFAGAVRRATDGELLAIPGMNKAILAKIRELLG